MVVIYDSGQLFLAAVDQRADRAGRDLENVGYLVVFLMLEKAQ